jgi:perosamine synthetase
MIEKYLENKIFKAINIKNSNVGLHEPFLSKQDHAEVKKCIESTFVSTVGIYINKFEKKLSSITGAKYVIATNTGTSALQAALFVSGATSETNVILSPVTFVASANAIKYNNAIPIFIDCDDKNFCLCPDQLKIFLEKETYLKDNKRYFKKNRKVISAILVTHVFGSAALIDKIAKLAKKFSIKLIEDSAESLGCFYKNKHLGTFGSIGIISFNGNKIITTGAGGAIITNSKKLYLRAKHLISVAKKPHPWKFEHDVIGWDYRMPNLCAALGFSQLKKFNMILKKKKKLKKIYKRLFSNNKLVEFIDFDELNFFKSNNWLNAIRLKKDSNKRNKILNYLNKKGYQCRPVWTLINKLKPYSKCYTYKIRNAEKIEKEIIFLPSSPNLV